MGPPVTIGDCQGCGACLLTCPEHAIRPAGGAAGRPLPHRAGRGRRLVVHPARCTGCGECVEICPVDAIDFAAEEGGRP
jgi:NAD-dependent dihydropyrimidine dehydrogenase PreA subunit